MAREQNPLREVRRTARSSGLCSPNRVVIGGWCLVAAVIGGCGSTSQSPPPEAHEWPVQYLSFPTKAELDYRPMVALAHAALPLIDPDTGTFSGPGRIWIKGSPGVTSVSLRNGESWTLEAPNYVTVVEASSGPAIVEFDTGEGRLDVEVLVPDAEELNAPAQRFSLLSFGCFDPFTVFDGRPAVNPGDGTDRPGEKSDASPRLWDARALFAEASRGELDGFPNPALIVGCGDQVYVESAHDLYGKYGIAHPLSAWTVEPEPRPRLGIADYETFVERLYRHTWSFTSLDEAFRRLPAIMVWDDHEIRDGWGSHGDEHVYLDTYYAVTRRAFLDHQFSRGPRGLSPELSDARVPLHQSVTLHGLPIFVLDERSDRDIRTPRVLGERQWEAFETWMRGLDPGRCPYYVIVSPLPLFYNVTNLVELASNFEAEADDDLADMWNSPVNEAELDRILDHILANGQRGLRAIVVSGDMHLSALLRLQISDEEEGKSSVLAYEIVTSGLAGPVNLGGLKDLIGDRGRVEGARKEIRGVELRPELGLAASGPNFGGLEIHDGASAAHLVQVLPDGPVHIRVPLEWGRDQPPLSESVEAGRRSLPPLRERSPSR